MSEQSGLHPNWKAFEEGFEHAESSVDGRVLRLTLNNEQLALLVTHGLTRELDTHPASLKMPGHSSYQNYSLEEHTRWADLNKIPDGNCSYETRPAARNYGVRLRSGQEGAYEITADVRNEFEDNPDLGGARFLQSSCIKAIESLPLE